MCKFGAEKDGALGAVGIGPAEDSVGILDLLKG